MAAGGRTPKPPTLATLGDVVDARIAATGSRPVFFGGSDGERFVDTVVYDGTRLGPGATVSGPALIEEPFTVVVLAPGQRARLDQSGNYDIRAD